MIHWSTNRKICVAGAAILLACLVVSLTPWYRAYMASEVEVRCARYRILVETKYWELRNEEGAASESQEELLTQAVRLFYTRDEYTVTAAGNEEDTLTIDGLCPAGGRYTVYCDEIGDVHAVCSEPGHDRSYTEYEQ